MMNRFYQMIVLLSAGFFLSVLATGIYRFCIALYETSPMLAGAAIPAMPLVACVLGVMLYGLYEIYLAVQGVAILAYRFFYPKFWGKPGLPGHQETGPLR